MAWVRGTAQLIVPVKDGPADSRPSHPRHLSHNEAGPTDERMPFRLAPAQILTAASDDLLMERHKRAAGCEFSIFWCGQS